MSGIRHSGGAKTVHSGTCGGARRCGNIVSSQGADMGGGVSGEGNATRWQKPQSGSGGVPVGWARPADSFQGCSVARIPASARVRAVVEGSDIGCFLADGKEGDSNLWQPRYASHSNGRTRSVGGTEACGVGVRSGEVGWSVGLRRHVT
ncbi:hypothetical protein BDD12DRAFT_809157 [Trichophaea hybrida]|nr:hypothetical protein BDD12DRAFT_809157 [Trichophaea hybrida]